MYSNVNTNPKIDNDPNTISKINEMIKEGFEKLKSFVNIKSSKFEVYELEEKFNNIANFWKNTNSSMNS